MLIFEITKTNMPLPQKGLAPILIDPPHIYVAYTTQATISSVKHKLLSTEITWKNIPQTCYWTKKIKQIVWWLNDKVKPRSHH